MPSGDSDLPAGHAPLKRLRKAGGNVSPKEPDKFLAEPDGPAAIDGSFFDTEAAFLDPWEGLHEVSLWLVPTSQSSHGCNPVYTVFWCMEDSNRPALVHFELMTLTAEGSVHIWCFPWRTQSVPAADILSAFSSVVLQSTC